MIILTENYLMLNEAIGERVKPGSATPIGDALNQAYKNADKNFKEYKKEKYRKALPKHLAKQAALGGIVGGMVGHLKYRNNEEYKKKSKEEKAKILGKYGFFIFWSVW